MKIPRGDGGKPIAHGDSSYIYQGIYNPIVWIGKEAYRPRVETLVVRNRYEVFLRLYDKIKNGSWYTIPGGSIDADSTKIEQARNETNEEALFEIKNIYYTGIQYYDRYTPGFNRSGGDSPIEYAGTINDVFIAEYEGLFDKSKVEPKDLDPDIADNGKFYPIGDIVKYLRPEHLRALSDSKLVDNVVRTNILIAMSNGDVKRAVSESLTPDFDVVPPPGDFIYHGSRFEIDVFHPMSIDFGNAKQKPGWSTFCFADPTLALRFGLMRTIQNALGDGCDRDGAKFRCEWNFETNRPYIIRHQAEEVFNKVIQLKFYVYHIQTEGLDIGIGNDIRFPEYTFREDNIRPRFVSTYTIDRALMDANMDYLDLISAAGCERYLYDNEDLKKRHYATFINRDYNNDPVIKKIVTAVNSGELKPGDDVEEFMRVNNLIPEEVVWESITEAAGINVRKVAMTKENLAKHKDKNKTSMLRHVRTPDDKNKGYFLEDSQGGMVGYVTVDTDKKYITALEVEKRYRRLGIGKDLLDIALRNLDAKYLSVNKRNIAAIDLYKKWNWATYKEDDHMLYMKAPGVTYTMDGYSFLPTDITAMVPVTEQRLTAADRKKLSDKDYGIPSLRKYPMPDKKHVISAIQYFNKVEPKYETELARNILKKVKEFDMEKVVSVSPDNRFSKYAPKTMLESNVVSLTEGGGSNTLFRLVESKPTSKYLHPSVPRNYMTDNGYEDNTTKRVCFSTSIDGCLRAYSQNIKGKTFYVLKPKSGYKVTTPTIKQVPYVKVTGERWITDNDIEYSIIGTITVGDSTGDGHKYRYGNGKTAELYDWDWSWTNKSSAVQKSAYNETMEVMINEPPVKKNLDFRNHKLINYEKWESGESNIIWITGLSGSGKTTLAKSIAYNDKAEYIGLDWLFDKPEDRPDDILQKCNAIFFNDCVNSNDIEKATTKALRFIRNYAKSHRNKRFVVEGIQVYYSDSSVFEDDPIVIVDYPKSRIMMQRFKRDVVRDIANYVKGTIKRYSDNNQYEFNNKDPYSPINQFNNFKKEILESTFIDIDELEPGYGEKSYGTPIDRTIDNVSSRKLESRYKKFVVSKYLHHGEYFGYTDWEKSINKYITKKEYDMGLYYVYGNNSGYPEYIGQILVDSDKNWHWYEAASPMAVTESWNNHDDDKETLVKLVDELRLWQYGYVYQGHCYTNFDDETSFLSRYRTLSTPDFEKYKCGTCFDYTAYIYQKMFSLCTEDEEQFMTQCYYIEAVDVDGVRPCHTFPIVRLRNGKYYWLEAAWKKMAGVREYNNLQEALAGTVNKFLQSYNLDNYKILCVFTPDKRFVNIGCFAFMRLAGSNTNIKVRR